MERAQGPEKGSSRSANCLLLVPGFLLGLLCLEGMLKPSVAPASEARLLWVLSAEADTIGYRVYYGNMSRYEEDFSGYPCMEELGAGDFDVSDGKGSWLLDGLSEDRVTWVSLTAFDAKGNESAFSNEKKIASSGNTGPGPVWPCQTAPPGLAPTPLAVGLPGWLFLFLAVPAWILVLRPRAARRRVVALKSRHAPPGVTGP